MEDSDNNIDYYGVNIGIVGLGFVGLPLALLLLKKGFNVTGIDHDKQKIDLLMNSQSYIEDISDVEVSIAIESGRFLVSHSYELLRDVDTIIICVPTPLTEYRTPDLTFITSAAYSIFPYLQDGQMVILESSTYPGTTKEVLLPILEKSGLKVGTNFYLCYSPERIDPGNTLHNVEDVPKVISGVTDSCKQRIDNLYKKIFKNVVGVSTTEAAEFCKLLENSFRYINISFINEIAIFCESLHIDIWEVIQAASSKPYGFMPFYPGPGIGGHCIPVDPEYLAWKAKQSGFELSFLKLANSINLKMPDYVVTILKNNILKDLYQKNILLYGLAYKKDISDYRESQAITIMNRLIDLGANVSYHDPYIPEITLKGKTYKSVELTPETIRLSDCVTILTDHSTIPIELIVENSRFVYDTRNVTGKYSNRTNVLRLGSGTP